MPTKPDPKITAWSYSKLKDYEQCPLKAKLKYIDGLKEPEAPALARGTRVHSLAEQYLTGSLNELPDELSTFREEFAALAARRRSLRIEQEMACDKSWQPCDWMAPDVWLRAKIDCAYDDLAMRTKTVIDFKTGKVRGDATDQLDLYAAVTMADANGAERVDCQLWYVDQGELISRSYVMSEIQALRDKLAARSSAMLADRVFAPTAGSGCRWCPWAKSKGGPCPL